jgi:hypothetical protein
VGSGTENLNRHVDAFVKSGLIKRRIAQIDISFSNSMIESFLRTIKHCRLFMLSLDDIECVRKYVGEFIEDYKILIPHSAFHVATLSEMYLGSRLPAQIDELDRAEEQASFKRSSDNFETPVT